MRVWAAKRLADATIVGLTAAFEATSFVTDAMSQIRLCKRLQGAAADTILGPADDTLDAYVSRTTPL